MTQFSSITKFNPKLLLVGLLIAAGVSTYVVKIKEAKAAVGASGLTGKYSCMTNRNFSPNVVYLTGTSSDTVGANTLGILDFDAHTSNLIIYYNDNWNTSTAAAGVTTGTGTFSEAAGPITGSYTLTQSITFAGDSSASTVAMNIVPSNSGNTFFLSLKPTSGNGQTPETGVCQKQ
jgi:hypothetical protein